MSDLATFDLTPEEVSVVLGGLYPHLTETKSYIRTSQTIVDAHANHGEECCGRGLVERERESLGYLQQRRDSIRSAIAKFESAESR